MISEVELDVGFVCELDNACMLILSNDFNELFILDLLRTLTDHHFEDRIKLSALECVSNMQYLLIGHITLLAGEVLERGLASKVI